MKGSSDDNRDGTNRLCAGRPAGRSRRWLGSGTGRQIQLVPGLPEESLDGIGDFSHAARFCRVLGTRQPDAVCWGPGIPGNTAWPVVGIFAQRARNRPNRWVRHRAQSLAGRPRLHVAGLDASKARRSWTSNRCWRSSCRGTRSSAAVEPHELMRDYWTPAPRGRHGN